MKIYNNITELTKRTPTVRVKHTTKYVHAGIVVRLERLSPIGEIKGRVALAMIEVAERNGQQLPGTTVLEPTSGSADIALAVVCGVKGYRCILVMLETMSRERQMTLRAWRGAGADIPS